MTEHQIGNVPAHLERHFGPISRGWSSKDGAVGVSMFVDQPAQGVRTFATLGVSKHVLKVPDGEDVRMEFIVSAYDRFPEESLVKLIGWFGEIVLDRHEAPENGTLVHLPTPVVEGSKASSLLVFEPFHFPETLVKFTHSVPKTLIAAVYPLLPSEVDFFKAEGVEAFLEKFYEINPDFFDLEREPFL